MATGGDEEVAVSEGGDVPREGSASTSATDEELRVLFPHLDPKVVRRVLEFVPLDSLRRRSR